jgi:hypothetical protein
MSVYSIYQFDGIALPVYNQEHDLGTGTVDSTLLSSVGGTYDVWAGIQRTPRSHKFTLSGLYEAAEGTVYLTDHAGNNIVDHASNRLIVGTAENWLRGQVDALRARLGVAGELRRRRVDDTSVWQWKTARLLAVGQKPELQHRNVLAKMDLVFETAMSSWRDSALDTVTGTLVAGGQVGLLLSGDGNATIEDSTISVAASGGAITSVQIAAPELGVDLRWTGTIADGRTLAIDCGAQTVLNGGTPAYSGFSLGTGHTARGWLPLPPGLYVMVVSSDGPGSVTSRHYDQWV